MAYLVGGWSFLWVAFGYRLGIVGVVVVNFGCLGFSWCWVLLVVVWVVLFGFVFDVQGFGLLGFGVVVLVMWLVTLLVVSVG